ncbi:DUF4393 domain-containing protein [Terasakiella pusilla]|uniref:DUF4393 domain-containing protein n=1 Tax=Terasakiella pusilla TaxID=64973 RepID=UPI00048D0E12|nr:DUF4393 domain-containing protein [Terasakiella pusilla]
MSEEEKKEGNIEETIHAVTELVKAVPVYQDAFQPAAQEVGKALGTVAKTVNVALAPVAALVWGYDQIRDFVDNKVTEKLQNIPEENIVTPPTHIAGPALESLRYTGSIGELKELYANLLASSMDSSTKKNAHPSFVEIIKQLSSDEAKLLTAFTSTEQAPAVTVRNNRRDQRGGLDHFRHFTLLGEKVGINDIYRLPNNLDNLCRLGLLEIPATYELIDDNLYKELDEHPLIRTMVETINAQNDRKAQLLHKTIIVTGLGRQFIDTCVTDHRDYGKSNLV